MKEISMNTKEKKVGVITLPMNANYGCVLQAHSMLSVINQLGYKSVLVNRRWNETPSMMHNIKRLFYQMTIMRPFNQFINEFVTPSTTRIVSHEELVNEAQKDYYAFVVGSDQVWRYKNTVGVGNNFFLDFILDPSVKRIAYAPSLGVDFWDDDNKSDMSLIKGLLERFNAISIREKSGVSVLKNNFGVDSINVLDPTLLLDADYYKTKFGLKENKRKILAVYVLDISDEQEKVIEKIAKEKGLTAVYLAPPKKAVKPTLDLLVNYRKYSYVSVLEWLNTFANAEYIITDSFHGTCFSIIFEKQFITIANKRRGKARFASLLEIFNLENRMCDDIQEIMDSTLQTNINFDVVSEILMQKKQACLSFLKSALSK